MTSIKRKLKRSTLHFISKYKVTKYKVQPALILYITPVVSHSENKVQIPPHKFYNDLDEFKTFLYAARAFSASILTCIWFSAIKIFRLL